MQLRVARLCLDCEELHTEDRCPRCISEHYAMVSTWLPVEERRRFRRPARTPAAPRHGVAAILDKLVRWFKGGEIIEAPERWATRRSDQIASMGIAEPSGTGKPHVIHTRRTERAHIKGT